MIPKLFVDSVVQFDRTQSNDHLRSTNFLNNADQLNHLMSFLPLFNTELNTNQGESDSIYYKYLRKRNYQLSKKYEFETRLTVKEPTFICNEIRRAKELNLNFQTCSLEYLK